MIKQALFLTLIATLTSQLALSKEDDIEQAAANDKRMVVIAERQAQTEEQVTGSVTVIGNELNSILPNHLNEISAEVPGLWISKGNGQEHLTAIRSPVFTGPGSCAEFLMMQNSVPLRAKGFCNVNQLFESFFEQASQIEVVRGTHSAFYGSDAVHGIINVNTQALNGLVSPGQKFNFTYGEFGFIRADYKSNLSDQAIKLNINKDSGVKRDSGVDQQKLQYEFLTNTQSLSIHTVASATNLNQDTAGYLQMGEDAYRDPSNLYVNDFPEAYRDARSFRIQSTLKSLTDDSWSLTPYARYTDMSFLMHFLPGQPVESNGHYSIGVNTDFRFDKTQFDWRYGIDAELTRGYLEQFQSNATDTGIAFLDEVLPTGQQYDFEVDSFYLGSFVAADWNTDSFNKFSAGLRLDYVQYDYDNRMLTGRTKADGTTCGFGGCRYTRPADRSDSFTQPSAFVSYAFQHSDNLKYYFKLDKGFRAPQVTEMYRLQNGQETADLESQEVNSFETGLRFYSEDFLTALTAFYMEKSNVIYQNTDRAWVYNATTDHSGIEWSANYFVNDHWRLNTQWTWAKHRYTNNSELTANSIDGNDIDTAPRNMGALSVLWSPTSSFEMRTSLRKLGRYFLNPENTESYPGHITVSVDASWEITPQTRLNFKVQNLTDKRYADRADFAFGQHRYFVAEPRRIFLGGQLALD